MLTNLIVEIILQYIHRSNHYIVPLTLTQCYISIVFQLTSRDMDFTYKGNHTVFVFLLLTYSHASAENMQNGAPHRTNAAEMSPFLTSIFPEFPRPDHRQGPRLPVVSQRTVVTGGRGSPSQDLLFLSCSLPPAPQPWGLQLWPPWSRAFPLAGQFLHSRGLFTIFLAAVG